jgi:hypothetical protein
VSKPKQKGNCTRHCKGGSRLKRPGTGHPNNDNDDDSTTIITDEYPLMEDSGIIIAGDGSLSYTFLTLKAVNLDGFKNIHNFCRGFHWDLKLKQCHGLRFGNSHLKYFLHPFQDTYKKQDWYQHYIMICA